MDEITVPAEIGYLFSIGSKLNFRRTGYEITYEVKGVIEQECGDCLLKLEYQKTERSDN